MAKKKKRKDKIPALAVPPRPERSPSLVAAPSVTKKPSAHVPNWMDDNPSWGVSLLEVVEAYGWHEVESAKLLNIRQKLANYESMTWREILADYRYNHSVRVERLIPEARRRLRAIGLGSLDELLRLRLMGAERVWGHRVGAVLHIIWWDPEHEICPSRLRNT